jgi:hypothetical protein
VVSLSPSDHSLSQVQMLSILAFYDIHERKREVLSFYFVLDATRELTYLTQKTYNTIKRDECLLCGINQCLFFNSINGKSIRYLSASMSLYRFFFMDFFCATIRLLRCKKARLVGLVDSILLSNFRQHRLCLPFFHGCRKRRLKD